MIKATVGYTPAYQSYFSSGDESEVYCLNCNELIIDESWNYCPNCGAKLVYYEDELDEDPTDYYEEMQIKRHDEGIL